MKDNTKYIERSDLNGATHLEVRVFYDLGGMSYFSGSNIPRGYFVSVRPVTKRDGVVRFEMFSGKKRLLFETARFSAKQFSRAVVMAMDFEDELISAVVAENKAA